MYLEQLRKYCTECGKNPVWRFNMCQDCWGCAICGECGHVLHAHPRPEHECPKYISKRDWTILQGALAAMRSLSEFEMQELIYLFPEESHVENI